MAFYWFTRGADTASPEVVMASKPTSTQEGLWDDPMPETIVLVLLCSLVFALVGCALA